MGAPSWAASEHGVMQPANAPTIHHEDRRVPDDECRSSRRMSTSAEAAVRVRTQTASESPACQPTATRSALWASGRPEGCPVVAVRYGVLV